jgi:hypothetical protein
VYKLDLFGWNVSAYEGVIALVLNLVISVVGTLVLSALGAPRGDDQTADDDYEELGERRVAAPPVAPIA